MFLFQTEIKKQQPKGRTPVPIADIAKLEEIKTNTDVALNNRKYDPVVITQFKALTASPLSPNGKDMSKMSNPEIIQTLHLLGQTAESDKRRATVENNPAKLAEVDKRLEDLNAFLSACKITWDNVNDYMEFMRLAELNPLTDRLNATKADVRDAGNAVRTTAKQMQTSAEGLEGDLAETRDGLVRDKLRDLIPRKLKVSSGMKPPGEFA